MHILDQASKEMYTLYCVCIDAQVAKHMLEQQVATGYATRQTCQGTMLYNNIHVTVAAFGHVATRRMASCYCGSRSIMQSCSS